MKEFAKKCLFLSCGLACKSSSFFRLLRSESDTQITIPFYHAVSDEYLPHLHHIVPYKNCDQFRKDICFFVSNFSLIGIPELLAFMRGEEELPPSPMLITFDDGLSEFYENALPILEEYSVPAAVFVNSGFLDNKHLFYRHKASLLVDKLNKGIEKKQLDQLRTQLNLNPRASLKRISYKIVNIEYPEKEIIDSLASILEVDFSECLNSIKPYLTSNQIREILAKGHFIGGHSIDHPEYARLTIDQQLHQTIESTQIISNKFSLPYRIFAAPYHDVAISKNYFDTIIGEHVQLSFGIDGTKQDIVPQNLQRFNLENEKHYSARTMLSTYYFVKIMFKLLGLETIQRPVLS